MRKTKYTVKTTTLFKKDFKLAMKRGLNIELLENIISRTTRSAIFTGSIILLR